MCASGQAVGGHNSCEIAIRREFREMGASFDVVHLVIEKCMVLGML
jgi:hypothetical protein